jgi:hypothetical protein
MQVFEVDILTREPLFHHIIIITPPRLGDAEAIVDILNDPRIYPTLKGPPFPYEHHHAIEWLLKVKTGTDEVGTHTKCSHKLYERIVRRTTRQNHQIIRQINQDGTQTFLGNCGIDRWGYQMRTSVVDSWQKTQADSWEMRKSFGPSESFSATQRYTQTI